MGEVVKPVEFSKQEITKEDIQQGDVKNQNKSEKGAQGLKEILTKDKIVSSETSQQQKEDYSLVTTETVKESAQETNLGTNVKTKETTIQEKTTEPVLKTKPVPVSPQQKPLETGQVVITVYKARDIEKKGMFGKADPYVKMTLGKQKAKSATVKNNH